MRMNKHRRVAWLCVYSFLRRYRGGFLHKENNFSWKVSVNLLCEKADDEYGVIGA